MKKIILFTVLILGTVSSLLAQSQASIRGTVTDDRSAAIAAATISLLRSADSTLVKIAVSDADGRYLLAEPGTGSFLIMATAVGHETLYSPEFVLTGKGIELEPLRMVAAATAMEAVTVVKKKPLVEQKIDRTIINVDAAVTNTGATALEVLEKSPGVQVDKDGNISIKGKQGVVVLIDGRPAYLSGAELAAMLGGMEASQLDQIEIMTNPPAKYDAAGNSGVINIKTKKNRKKGFNGSITAGGSQGIYSRANGSLNLNYMHNKVNLFANYSYGYRNRFHELLIHRRYLNDDKSPRAIFDQKSTQLGTYQNNNLKIGMDFYLTRRTTLGITASGFYNPEDNLGHNTSFLKNPQSEVDSIVYSGYSGKELWKNGSINLNMRHNFDSTGRELTTDIDYINYNTVNQPEFVNSIMNPVGVKKYDEYLRGDLPMNIDIYSARIDYTHPMKKGKFETGLKSSIVNTVNKANYHERIGSVWEKDYKRTNYFDYSETIHAAYLNMNRPLSEKVELQAGLRYEYTSYKGEQFGNPTKNDSSFSRNYGSLFPTVYLSYKPAEKHQFGISAGRRINRPRYHDMNPFMFFIDKYTYAQGNPYLRPQYSNNFELSHILNGKFTTTLSYSATKDLFTEVFDQPKQEDGYDYSTIVKKGNIGKVQQLGLSFSAQLSAGSWLTSSLYGQYNYSIFKGMVNGELLDAAAGNMTFNVNNQIRFNQKWSGELSGWYRTPGLEGQVYLQDFGQLNIGVARQVLKSKGSVKLTIRDLLYTQKVNGNMKFKNTEASFQNRPDNRMINLTFSYRFGKPIKTMAPRNKDRGVEEQNRVGG